MESRNWPNGSKISCGSTKTRVSSFSLATTASAFLHPRQSTATFRHHSLRWTRGLEARFTIRLTYPNGVTATFTSSPPITCRK